MRVRNWPLAWILLAVIIVLVLFGRVARAQVQISFITSSDPSEFANDTPIPAGSIDHRELLCGHAPGSYPMSMLLPASGRITQAEFLVYMPIKLDTSVYCKSLVKVGGVESSLSNEIVFFCDQVPPRARRVYQCWRGERVPPGQRR